MSQVLERLKNSILEFDEDEALEAAKAALEAGENPIKAVDVMGDALNELGDKFQAMEVFLPEIILASDAFKNALTVLEPEIKKQNAGSETNKIPVVIGTVQGDIHQVGKDMVCTMLITAGFDVHDLGVDVAPSRFLEEANKLDAKIICASALMSTTRPVQKDLIDFLVAKGVRDKFKVFVGGGVVTQEWADEIGADYYSLDAIEAAEIAKRIAPTL